MVRLFIAIDLPDEVKGQLVALCSGMSGAKWVRREALHLTLRFIGEVGQPQFQAIRTALETVHSPPFSLTLKGVGQFPPRGKPRVLWVGVDAPPALGQVYQQVESRLVELGLPPDDHAFFPHITLARFKSPPDADSVRQYYARHTDFETESFPVQQVVLYSSRLTPGGAEYTPESASPFKL